MDQRPSIHRHCRNYAPLDVIKGICHVDKERVAADDPSCESFDPMPKCAHCSSFAPSETPHLGICQASPRRPMTYPELVGLNCEWFAWREEPAERRQAMNEERDLEDHQGLIFDIQGFSVHDGPGCRTLVFLSGCPLRCRWCANPEGLLERPRLMYRAARCRPSAHRCISACPVGAIRRGIDPEPAIVIDRTSCARCTRTPCVEACYHGALERAGRWMTVDELMRLLRRDREFWGAGGGVTFGGGEPLAQPGFLQAALKRCREDYLHTALETSAHAPTELLFSFLPLLDWLFVDLKHMFSATHRDGTGVGNELIIENLVALASSDWQGRVIVRIPIIPGFNDSPSNLEASAVFLRDHDLSEVNLVPFHRLATSKYEQLGEPYPWAAVEPPTPTAMKVVAAFFSEAGLRCYVDDQTPF